MTGTTERASQAQFSDEGGTADIFDELAREAMPGLLRYFVRRTETREDASDCLSETMLILWRKRNHGPAKSDEYGMWAYSVASRVLANHRRARQRRLALHERCRVLLSDNAQQAGPEDGNAGLALCTLKQKDRELVMLIVWDSFGVAEAGQLLGLTPTAARSRYARARKTLQGQLTASEPN